MFGRVTAETLRSMTAKRICLIKPSAFGDVVQSLPLLPALRRRFPDAQIAWVVNRSLRDLLTGHPDLNEVIEFDRSGSWSSWWKTLQRLRQARFDLVLDLQGLLRTAVMTRVTRAPVRIGLETAREGSSLSCHYLIPNTGHSTPAHQRYWNVAEALGVGHLPRTARIVWSAEDSLFARQQLQYMHAPVIAIHAGARWQTKRWPVEHFAEVARRAVAAYRATIVLVGTPDERELGLALHRAISGKMIGAAIRNLVGRTSLKQLAAVLDHCDMVLTNDSGPMHLAAGLGTPVVGIFTCTSPERSGPPPGPHALVATTVDCAGSYCRVCPLAGPAHQRCHQELTPDRVWRAVQQVMDRSTETPSAA